jgi:uncharacterized delta-60 repeat protein
VDLTTLGKATAAVAVQPDDRIVVAGTSGGVTTSQVGLARLNPDGSPDATFGSGGFALTPPSSRVNSVVLQSDGKIVVAGNESGNFMVARYNSGDGSLDSTFGSNGVAVSAGMSVPPSLKVSLALEPDGRIVVAGSEETTAGHYSFVLARFLAAGPQIGSFTASPNPVTAGSSVTLTAANVVAFNPNSTVTQVAFYLDSNGDGILEPGTDTLLGYATQTGPGTWTLTVTTAGLAPGTYTFFAVAEDTYGVFSDPLALTLQVL